MAVTVGISGHPTTVHDEFEVTSMERPDVQHLASKIGRALQSAGEERRNVILAALAEVSALYLGPKAADGYVPVDPTVLEQVVGYGSE